MQIKHSNVSLQKCRRYADYKLYIHVMDGNNLFKMIVSLNIVEHILIMLIRASSSLKLLDFV